MFRIVFLLVTLLFSANNFASIIMGNAHGTISLTEVYDYQCIHCHRMFPIVSKLIENHPELKVKLMPVAILNETSLPEAAAAIAATEIPGRFQLLNEVMMSGQPLSDTQFHQVLMFLGLNNPSFVSRMHGDDVKQQLSEGIKLLKTYHSQSVPFFIIKNNHKTILLKGEQSYNKLEQGISHDI